MMVLARVKILNPDSDAALVRYLSERIADRWPQLKYEFDTNIEGSYHTSIIQDGEPTADEVDRFIADAVVHYVTDN